MVFTITPPGTIDSVLGFTTGDKTVRAGVIGKKEWSFDTLILDDVTYNSITYGDGLFVATNSIYGSPPHPGDSVLVSSDAINWSKHQVLGGIALSWLGVAYGKGIYAAIGSRADSLSLYSYNAKDWNVSSSPISSSCNYVTYGNETFVAVRSTAPGKIYTSSNGDNWTLQSGYDTTAESYGPVCFGNNTFVCFGVNTYYLSGQLLTSTDGVTWTSGIAYDTTYSFYSCTYGNGLFVAVGSEVSGGAGKEYIIITSRDAVIWEKVDSSTTRRYTAIAYGEGEYVSVGSDIYPYDSIFATTSTNGVDWTTALIRTEPNLVISFFDMVYGNGTFVAISGAQDSALVLTYGNSNSNITPETFQAQVAIHDHAGDTIYPTRVKIPTLEPWNIVTTDADTSLYPTGATWDTASSAMTIHTVLADTVRVGSATNNTTIDSLGLEYNGVARTRWKSYYCAGATYTEGSSADAVTLLNSKATGVYTVVEGTGTSPGISVLFIFTGVTAFNRLEIIGEYRGTSTHCVPIRLRRDGGTYDCFGNMNSVICYDTTLATRSLSNYSFDVDSCENYLQNDSLYVQYYHDANGNSTHRIYLSEMVVKQ